MEPRHGLTEQQIGSVMQNLIRQNVPIPVVVNVMEGILTGEGSSAVGCGDSFMADVDTTAPPSYDFHRASRGGGTSGTSTWSPSTTNVPPVEE